MNEQKLRKFIFDTWQIPKSESHEHSRDVELLGKLIYEESAFPEKIDMDVVRWFAYIHDVKVGDDHADRAAMLIDNMRDSYLKELTDEQITKLKEACKGHEKKVLTDDETIQVCWDADRLDLPRVGVILNPIRMATIFGYCYALNTYDCNLEQSKEFMRNL